MLPRLAFDRSDLPQSYHDEKLFLPSGTPRARRNHSEGTRIERPQPALVRIRRHMGRVCDRPLINRLVHAALLCPATAACPALATLCRTVYGARLLAASRR